MHEATRLAAPPADPEVRRLRSTIGAHRKHGNDEAAAATRRELEWHQLEAHVSRVAAEHEPLTDAQRELAAWAEQHAAKAPRISPADAAPLIGIFRGAGAVSARAS